MTKYQPRNVKSIRRRESAMLRRSGENACKRAKNAQVCILLMTKA